MGRYINVMPDGQPMPNRGKADELMGLGAVEAESEIWNYAEVPENVAIVCVIFNGPFDAALYCCNQMEVDATHAPGDLRRKHYLLMDKTLVEAIAK